MTSGVKPSARRAVYERDGHRCADCGTGDDLTLDHIIPKSRGGTNEQWNLVTMCRPCNNFKGNTTRVDLFPEPRIAAKFMRQHD